MKNKTKEKIVDYLKIAGGISLTSPLAYALFVLDKIQNPLGTTIFVYLVLIGMGIGLFSYLQSGQDESIN